MDAIPFTLRDNVDRLYQHIKISPLSQCKDFLYYICGVKNIARRDRICIQSRSKENIQAKGSLNNPTSMVCNFQPSPVV